MAQYCDSARLERHWFYWLVASAVPALEPYRARGLLWTKVAETQVAGKTVVDPCTPVREHCIALATPVFLQSIGPDPGNRVPSAAHPTAIVGELPDPAVLCDTDDSAVHRLQYPFLQQGVLVPMLQRAGYFLEPAVGQSWLALIAELSSICNGVVRKFNPQSEEEKDNLSNEALSQVMRKLADRKLVYTPGRAPVFNLMTTTVFHCLYSTMNQESRQRKRIARLREDLRSGVLPRTHRSLRVPGLPIKA